MMEFIGWLGGVMLAVCSLPAALSVYRKGNADGMDSTFLHLWAWGEIFTLIYTAHKAPDAMPLLFNYAMNIIGLAIIFRYKIRRRD